MEREEIRQIILRELPALVKQDRELREWVQGLIRQHTLPRAEIESRFDRLLAELRAMREESERKWDEQSHRWEEQTRRWEEQNRRWEEQNRRWEEQSRRWEEQNRKWAENQKQIRALIEKIEKVDHRIDRTIGALGARWGLSSEASFRKALSAILEKSFNVTVERVEFWDEQGKVFGRPDQVELDVIIRDGEVLACELKSSASRSDVYAFERKVRAYEERVGRKVKRMILVSPMVEPRARKVAQELGIEVYSDAEEVPPQGDETDYP